MLKEFNELFTERVADEPFDKQQPDKVLNILQMLDLLDLADGHERLFALEWPEGEALKVKRAVPSEWNLSLRLLPALFLLPLWRNILK